MWLDPARAIRAALDGVVGCACAPQRSPKQRLGGKDIERVPASRWRFRCACRGLWCDPCRSHRLRVCLASRASPSMRRRARVSPPCVVARRDLRRPSSPPSSRPSSWPSSRWSPSPPTRPPRPIAPSRAERRRRIVVVGGSASRLARVGLGDERGLRRGRERESIADRRACPPRSPAHGAGAPEAPDGLAHQRHQRGETCARPAWRRSTQAQAARSRAFHRSTNMYRYLRAHAEPRWVM